MKTPDPWLGHGFIMRRSNRCSGKELRARSSSSALTLSERGRFFFAEPVLRRLTCLPRSSWLPTAYAILLTSAFNYGAQAWANRYSSPTTVTAFFPLQIGFAALFQWVFLGAPPSKWEYVGGFLTISGLALMVLARRRVAVAAAEAESEAEGC